MATCPVRFEFQTELQGTLRYVHNVPRGLITPNAQGAQRDPEHIKNFVSTIQPIMKEHEVACLAASNPKCQCCGSPTFTVLQSPMSWLHKVDDPFVVVWVNPVCNKKECEIRARQQIQDTMVRVQGTAK